MAYYARRLEHLLGKAAFWVHEHTHESFIAEINRTRIICNPHGYNTFGRTVEKFIFYNRLVVEGL